LQDTDLQSALSAHNYDALLYGISLGADPDVFAYWHSSQADLRSPSRLNFSEYRSAVADKALEGGRTRSVDAVRAAKYRPFLDAWQKDTPALALYQPRYLYLARDPLFGFAPVRMNSGADRLDNVENWKIRLSDQPMIQDQP
jgi:peptide/nickel transport system substrate-binding protein